jgi:uncharacterized membrane protein
MSLKLKILLALLPKEVREMVSTILNFLNGKKTLIGLVIGFLPQFIDAVTQMMGAAGADTTVWTKIAGGILMFVGLIHKFIKVDAPVSKVDAPVK